MLSINRVSPNASAPNVAAATRTTTSASDNTLEFIWNKGSHDQVKLYRIARPNSHDTAGVVSSMTVSAEALKEEFSTSKKKLSFPYVFKAKDTILDLRDPRQIPELKIISPDPIQIAQGQDMPRDLPPGKYDLVTLDMTVSKPKKSFLKTITANVTRAHQSRRRGEYQALLPYSHIEDTKKRTLLGLLGEHQQGGKALYLLAPQAMESSSTLRQLINENLLCRNFDTACEIESPKHSINTKAPPLSSAMLSEHRVHNQAELASYTHAVDTDLSSGAPSLVHALAEATHAALHQSPPSLRVPQKIHPDLRGIQLPPPIPQRHAASTHRSETRQHPSQSTRQNSKIPIKIGARRSSLSGNEEQRQTQQPLLSPSGASSAIKKSVVQHDYPFNKEKKKLQQNIQAIEQRKASESKEKHAAISSQQELPPQMQHSSHRFLRSTTIGMAHQSSIDSAITTDAEKRSLLKNNAGEIQALQEKVMQIDRQIILLEREKAAKLAQAKKISSHATEAQSTSQSTREPIAQQKTQHQKTALTE